MEKDKTDQKINPQRIVTRFTSGDRLHIPHPYLGGTLSHDVEVHCRIGGDEWTEHTDTYGHRIHKQIYPLLNHDRIIDIVFAGCSWCYGMGVNKPYPVIVGEKLGVSFVNLGVPGYSLLQSYRRLKHWLEYYPNRPKIIIYGYGQWQLVRCVVWKYMAWTRPFFVTTRGNKLAIKEPMGTPERLLWAVCRRLRIPHGWERIYWRDHATMDRIYLRMYSLFNGLAQTYGCKLLFFEFPKLQPDNFLKYEKKHPNNGGHKKIAEQILKSIEGYH